MSILLRYAGISNDGSIIPFRDKESSRREKILKIPVKQGFRVGHFWDFRGKKLFIFYRKSLPEKGVGREGGQIGTLRTQTTERRDDASKCNFLTINILRKSFRNRPNLAQKLLYSKVEGGVSSERFRGVFFASLAIFAVKK